MFIENISRRQFLKHLGVVGSGLALGVQFDSSEAASSSEFSPDVFIAIDGQGTVTIISHRSEMGQGIRSSTPLLMADELEADWARVEVKQALGDKKYGSQNTDGSRSIRKIYQRYKVAGATVRTMLQQAAAQRWQVGLDAVTIHNHQAILNGSDQRLDFAELVALAATLPVPAPETLVLKTDEQYRYVGKDNIKLLDGHAIATGQAIYGYDVQMEGLRVAVIARPPTVFGQVASYDASAALKVPGVEKVIELPALAPPAAFNMLGGIAVLASNTWAAIEGRKKLTIQWQNGPTASYSSKAYEQAFKQALEKPAHDTRSVGDWEQAKKAAATVLEEEYYVAALNHTPMEPPAATAVVTDDGVEVWAATQTPQRAQEVTMGLFDIAEDQAERVKVHVTLLGGAFGRKSKPDYVLEAAYLAKKTGWPVKVLWTREDDIKHGYYHSAAYHKLAACFDGNNKVDGWYFAMVNHPIGATFNPKVLEQPLTAGVAELGHSDLPFDVPNMRFTLGESRTYQRIGWVRSVTNINNAFAAGCFVDEMAAHVGADPKDFWLTLIGRDRQVDLQAEGFNYTNYGSPLEDYPVDTKRFKQVINYVADQAQWHKKSGKPRSGGRGIGIAAHRSFCSYVATVVEVVMIDGKVKVDKVHIAIDAGKVVNPDRVHSQLEGSVIFSLSNAFYGEITATEGVVEQNNFYDYQMLRMHQSPEIHTYILDSKAAPAGVGEPGVPPVAPALCNALFAATGERYRRLPLTQYNIV